jgi:hypothetical protein
MVLAASAAEMGCSGPAGSTAWAGRVRVASAFAGVTGGVGVVAAAAAGVAFTAGTLASDSSEGATAQPARLRARAKRVSSDRGLI